MQIEMVKGWDAWEFEATHSASDLLHSGLFVQLMYIFVNRFHEEESSSFNLSKHHQTKIPGKLNQVRSEMR